MSVAGLAGHLDVLLSMQPVHAAAACFPGRHCGCPSTAALPGSSPRLLYPTEYALCPMLKALFPEPGTGHEAWA